jgi:hypothetical protein
LQPRTLFRGPGEGPELVAPPICKLVTKAQQLPEGAHPLGVFGRTGVGQHARCQPIPSRVRPIVLGKVGQLRKWGNVAPIHRTQQDGDCVVGAKGRQYSSGLSWAAQEDTIREKRPSGQDRSVRRTSRELVLDGCRECVDAVAFRVAPVEAGRVEPVGPSEKLPNDA